MALLNFDSTQVDATSDFDLLPPGDYLCVITDSEERATKAGTGSYINLTLEVLEGVHKGRRVWDMLNLNNPNAQAVQIAQQTLAKICIAINKPQISDSAELHGVPLMARIAIKEDPGYGPKNVIKSYGAANDSAPVAPPQPTAPPAQPVAAQPIQPATPAASGPNWSQ